MKIVAIDVKSTHHNSEYGTILEFGAVGFDTSADFEPIMYHARFVPPSKFETDLSSILENLELMRDLDDFSNNRLFHNTSLYELELASLFENFFNWCLLNELLYATSQKDDYPYYTNVVGVNFHSKVLPLLKRHDDNWRKLIHKKVIDLNTLYIEPKDTAIPRFSVCKIRAGHVSVENPTALDKAKSIALLAHTKLSV